MLCLVFLFFCSLTLIFIGAMKCCMFTIVRNLLHFLFVMPNLHRPLFTVFLPLLMFLYLLPLALVHIIIIIISIMMFWFHPNIIIILIISILMFWFHPNIIIIILIFLISLKFAHFLRFHPKMFLSDVSLIPLFLLILPLT